MMKPDFNKVDINKVKASTTSHENQTPFITNEGIPVKSMYTSEDIDGIQHVK